MSIKPKIPKYCLICNTYFVPIRNNAKMCSLPCHVIYNNRTRLEYKRNWSKKHSEYYVQYNRLRRAKMLKAKPKWADDNKLKQIYKEAKEKGLTVDHIIPLNHPLVSGLHVPANLQLLTRAENTRKYNKFDLLVEYTE